MHGNHNGQTRRKKKEIRKTQSRWYAVVLLIGLVALVYQDANAEDEDDDNGDHDVVVAERAAVDATVAGGTDRDNEAKGDDVGGGGGTVSRFNASNTVSIRATMIGSIVAGFEVRAFKRSNSDDGGVVNVKDDTADGNVVNVGNEGDDKEEDDDEDEYENDVNGLGTPLVVADDEGVAVVPTLVMVYRFNIRLRQACNSSNPKY